MRIRLERAKQREQGRSGAVTPNCSILGVALGATLGATLEGRQTAFQEPAASQRRRAGLPERSAAMTGARKARSSATTTSNSSGQLVVPKRFRNTRHCVRLSAIDPNSFVSAVGSAGISVPRFAQVARIAADRR